MSRLRREGVRTQLSYQKQRVVWLQALSVFQLLGGLDQTDA